MLICMLMMNQLISDFSKNLEEAISIGSQTSFKQASKKLENVLICGLGGSGIGGTIIGQLVANQCPVPITINKDYHIPAFVGENTLVICSSYSGNTEETLSMYETAKEAGSEICMITSGGKFAEIAKSEGYNILQIPGGLPPRAAFGLAFPQLLFALYKYGLIDSRPIENIKSAIDLINEQEEAIREEAKEISKALYGKIPIIYSESSIEGVGLRFRQQLNENAKVLCWNHVVPEMNHNELVGWRTKSDMLAVLIFRSEGDYPRNKKRIEYSKDIISQYCDSIIEVFAKGDSAIERAIYFIHLGDWASYFLAELKGVDSVEVDVITGLKNMLAELN